MLGFMLYRAMSSVDLSSVDLFAFWQPIYEFVARTISLIPHSSDYRATTLVTVTRKQVIDQSLRFAVAFSNT